MERLIAFAVLAERNGFSSAGEVLVAVQPALEWPMMRHHLTVRTKLVGSGL